MGGDHEANVVMCAILGASWFLHYLYNLAKRQDNGNSYSHLTRTPPSEPDIRVVGQHVHRQHEPLGECWVALHIPAMPNVIA